MSLSQVFANQLQTLHIHSVVIRLGVVATHILANDVDLLGLSYLQLFDVASRGAITIVDDNVSLLALGQVREELHSELLDIARCLNRDVRNVSVIYQPLQLSSRVVLVEYLLDDTCHHIVTSNNDIVLVLVKETIILHIAVQPLSLAVVEPSNQ